MYQIVARRFEAHVVAAVGLDDIGRALREAVYRQPAGQVSAIDITPTDRPPMLAVRLRGEAPAISNVKNVVARCRDVRIVRDVIDLPSGAPPGVVYPDPRVLLRIHPERELVPGSVGGGERVIVAIVDSGIMVDHPCLKDHLWTGDVDGHRARGARCIGETMSDDVTDDDGHGTQVAGTILATADRAPGLQLMAVKFFDAATLPRAANAARAIDFAVDHQADIINLSWDVGLGTADLERAVKRACQAGALVVIAAGNNGTDNDRFPSIPAAYARHDRDRTITVMATDRYDEKAAFSNYGETTVDLAAPGVGIASTRPFLVPGDEARWYRPYRGTSAAAAHVAGAAALLRSRDRGLTADRLKRYLVDTVDAVSGLKCASGGRLNLGEALRYAANAREISPR